MTRSAYLLILFLGVISLSRPRQAVACPDIDGLADLNCDRTLTILAFGDSITYGRGDSSFLGYTGRLRIIFPNAVIVNLGLPGETTNAGRARAAKRFAQFPGADYAIILEGVNDYYQSGKSAVLTRTNLLSIVRSARTTGAATLLGNLTDVKRGFQKPWVRSVNLEVNPYRQIDFFALGESIIGGDLLHPHRNGYQAMAIVAAQALLNTSALYRPIDSDADGLNDLEEAKYGTNRFFADSDGDGLSDGQEIFTYRSNPSLKDSDNDGYGDADEVSVLRTDPNSSIPIAPQLRELKALPRN